MKRIFLIVLVIMAVQQLLHAQHISYRNQQEVGLVSYGPMPLEIGFAARSFHGVAIGDAHTLGVNVGVNRFPIEGKSTIWTVPLTIKNRYVLSPRRKAAFFTDLDVGYALASLNKERKAVPVWSTYDGGVVMNPQIGLKLASPSQNFFWTITGGYLYQRLAITTYSNYDPNFNSRDPSTVDWIGDFNRERNRYAVHRLTFMLGFGF
ncbi:hypothetical protein [Sphingobacterium griseoflavum]|uniref:Outer membrane protein beta-barrel domain-containing protein n=1 Tax=Sphingobacterium griseoflavum TaxID=1474952 RepID=A0ABQ3HSK1_9SPHI|nr:hypothetical protein [Sphingobacterium griseoflavum]GHE30312.1 hypothetical protein GCM10017764_11540 [Sphingobacterium griseoflavum]